MNPLAILVPVLLGTAIVLGTWMRPHGETPDRTTPNATASASTSAVSTAAESANEAPIVTADARSAIEIAADERAGAAPRTVSDTPSRVETAATDVRSDRIPATALLDVPFASQAPYNNWNMPFQEACEETSIIMAQYFLEGIAPLEETVKDQILAIVDYEDRLGYSHDLNIEDAGKVAEGFYGVKATTYHGAEVTKERIRQLVNEGHPVIVPAMGRVLANPHYTGDGPPYHMLVVIGYDGDGFITNDPGTRFGAGYHYSYATFMDAIHDWTGDHGTLENGEKAMLVLEKRR